MNFGEKLRSLREAKGMSQKTLADLCGERQSSLARWEAGLHVPGIDAVQRACVALGVQLATFDGCTHGAAKVQRGRGRPPKADPKPMKAKKKK